MEKMSFYGIVKLKKLVSQIFIILSTSSLCLAEIGVEPRSVFLLTHQPLSGTAKEYSVIGKSAHSYFKYVNDLGGVHGRSINLKIIDDQFKPNLTVKKVNEIIIKNDYFAIFSGIGGKTHQSIYSLLKKKKIPSFFVGSDLPEWTQPVRENIFGFIPNANTEASVIGKYLTKNHAGEEVIIWYAEKPVYSRAVKALTRELYGISVKLLAGKKGRLLAESKLISAKKPDLIVVLGNFSDQLGFLKVYKNLGIPVYTGHALADSRLTEWINRDIIEHVHVLTAYPLVLETEHVGYKFHKRILNEYSPHLIPNRWTIYGQAAAEVMVEVLERSGRSLNRKKSVLAAERIKKWQGNLLPPVFLDSQNHLALSSFRVSQILPNRVKHISDWIDGR